MTAAAAAGEKLFLDVTTGLLQDLAGVMLPGSHTAMALAPQGFSALAREPQAFSAMANNAQAFSAMAAAPQAFSALARDAQAMSAMAQFPQAFSALAREPQAFSVLATVLGHYPERNEILIDAGGLALSRDEGPTHLDPECGYGAVFSGDGKSHLATLRVRTRIPLGEDLHVAHVVVSDDVAYVTSFEADSVLVVDLAAREVVREVPLAPGTGPHGARLAPDGDALYVAGMGDGSLHVVDTATFEVTTRDLPGRAVQTAVLPDGKRSDTTSIQSGRAVGARFW